LGFDIFSLAAIAQRDQALILVFSNRPLSLFDQISSDIKQNIIINSTVFQYNNILGCKYYVSKIRLPH